MNHKLMRETTLNKVKGTIVYLSKRKALRMDGLFTKKIQANNEIIAFTFLTFLGL